MRTLFLARYFFVSAFLLAAVGLAWLNIIRDQRK
jgi:hypothetical protein